jgi:hypothetical protein
MKIRSEAVLRKHIRNWTIFFIAAIVLSGITAFPLETEMRWLDGHSGSFPSALSQWIHVVYTGLRDTNAAYPFLAYGTDWLAFAHLIIALLFVGVLKDPVKNKWVIEWSVICCLLVFPLALIAGPVRQIPFFHRLIDCAFGVAGLIPLMIVRRKIQMLESLHR